MKKPKLDLSLNNIITCAVYAVIGLLLIILKGGSLGILMTVVGVLLIGLGVMDIIKSKDDFVKGIVEIAAGVAIIVLGWLIASIVLLIFGIILIIKGGMDAWEQRKGGIASLLSPIVTIAIGVLLVVAKFALMDVLCIVAGVVFLVDAVLAFFGISLRK